MLENTHINYTFLKGLKSSKTSIEIKRILRKIWYFKMKQKKMTDIDRKADTRSKIMMGGLIKKAGLDYLHPNNADVLYGMLLENKKLLESHPNTIHKWKELGKDLTNISKPYAQMLQPKSKINFSANKENKELFQHGKDI